jgi:cytochrome c peroxidase
MHQFKSTIFKKVQMKQTILLFTAAILLAAALISMRSNIAPIGLIQQDYRNGLKELGNSISILKKNKNIEQFRQDYINLRICYKNIQSLLEYYALEEAMDYLKGSPSPKLERNTAEISVLDPNGIQVIDKILYSKEFAEGTKASRKKLGKEMRTVLGQLSKKFEIIKKSQLGIKLQNRHFFEATRFELIRIFTMGISGFDTPASELAIVDLEASLLTLSRQFEYYQDKFQGKNKRLFKDIQGLFGGAIKFTNQNSDFNSFDRLEFLVKYINPLFEKILEAQLALGIETIYEVEENKYSTNYLAKNIFADDFINPYYYTELIKKKDTDQLRELGMMLFFDPALSSDNKRACASCHNPKKAFTDGYKKSIAFGTDGLIQRNAPTLLNSVYASKYFYDMRADKLENQCIHVFKNDKEPDSEYHEIFKKLNKSKEYKKLFAACFPELKKKPITRYTLDAALASYTLSLRSFNSPFDKYIKGESKNISSSVRNGFNLFMGKAKCGTCHFAPTFAGLIPPFFQETKSAVLGVPINTDTVKTRIDPDQGRSNGMIKERAVHFSHSFKILTVRNIEHTSPYMHNGVYTTLEEVIDFYVRGGGIGLGLEVDNQTLPSDRLNLSDKEKQDIIAFLKSLTDKTFYDHMPTSLPKFRGKDKLNKRVIGGTY